MSYSAEVLADSPLLYWRMGEASGSVVDSSGNSRAGTAHATLTRDVQGALNADEDDGAIEFDGTSGYISSSYNPYAASSQRTFEVWAKTTAYASGGNKALLGGAAASPQLLLTTAGNVAFFYAGLSAASWTAVWPGDNRWVHVVLCFDATAGGTAPKLYINGVDQGAPSSGGAGAYGTTGNFTVAARGAAPSSFFPGSIDEVSIYSGFLSAARVIAHYNAALTHVQIDPQTLKWDTLAAVDASARTLKWDTIAAVDASARTLIWDTFTDALADPRTLVWDTIAAVDADPTTLIWDDAGGGSASPVDADPATLLWDDAGQANAAFTLLWDTLAKVDSDPATLLWDVRNAVNSNPITIVWDTPAQATSAGGRLVWDTYAAVDSRPKHLLWDILSDQPEAGEGGIVRGRMRRPRRARR